MAAVEPKPANLHVCIARRKGLVYTLSNVIPASRSPSRRALNSPRSVRGKSVSPELARRFISHTFVIGAV